MPTDAVNLDTAISQAIQRIVDVTASANPTYQIGGKSVQKAEYLQILTEQLQGLRLARQQADGAWEVRSVGRS